MPPLRASTVYSGTDTAWQAGVAYQFGPVKVGLRLRSRKYDMSSNGATDAKVTAWNIAGEWDYSGTACTARWLHQVPNNGYWGNAIWD